MYDDSTNTQDTWAEEEAGATTEPQEAALPSYLQRKMGHFVGRVAFGIALVVFIAIAIYINENGLSNSLEDVYDHALDTVSTAKLRDACREPTDLEVTYFTELDFALDQQWTNDTRTLVDMSLDKLFLNMIGVSQELDGVQLWQTYVTDFPQVHSSYEEVRSHLFEVYDCTLEINSLLWSNALSSKQVDGYVKRRQQVRSWETTKVAMTECLSIIQSSLQTQQRALLFFRDQDNFQHCSTLNNIRDASRMPNHHKAHHAKAIRLGCQDVQENLIPAIQQEQVRHTSMKAFISRVVEAYDHLTFKSPSAPDVSLTFAKSIKALVSRKDYETMEQNIRLACEGAGT